MGEIQIWDVAKSRLILSKPVGFDTAYGASWSPDGNYVAYGLPDNTVHAFDVEEEEGSFVFTPDAEVLLPRIPSVGILIAF